MIKLGFTAVIICSIILFIFLFLVCVMVAMLLLGDSFFKIGRWPALIALIICYYLTKKFYKAVILMEG